ncbi:MAG: tRNA (adenosine(37)-N6)-threonylcarbamoyltransferase complex ATPase subunit type 1 TsaE [Ginsengibacter sp.]
MQLLFSLDNIDSVAKELIPFLKNFKVVAFNGAMGVGKTTFIHALCRQIGVTGNMSSPTYSIIQQYKTTSDLIINHIDVYRLKDADEAVQAGVEDAIDSGDFCFIEWAEKITNILPFHFISVFIELVNHAERNLVIKFK